MQIFIKRKYFFIGALFLIFLSSCTNHYSGKKAPLAIKGLLDLRDWDFKRDGPVKLKGEWNFWWEKFIDPIEFDSSKQLIPGSAFFKVPSMWNGFTGFGPEKPVPGHIGYATFSLRLKLKPGTKIGLSLDRAGTAYALFIKDFNSNKSEIILKNGSPGKNIESSIPEFKHVSGNFYSESGELILIWHISNFHEMGNGPRNAILMGDLTTIESSLLYNRLQDMLLIGVLMMMAFYHFGLFALRRRDKASLVFGLLCLDVALRQFLIGRYFQIFSESASTLEWQLLFKLEFMTLYFALYLLCSFIYQLLPSKKLIILIRLVLVTVAFFTLLTIFTEATVYTRALLVLFAVSGLTLIVLGLHILKRAQLADFTARAFLLAMLPLVLAVVHDILVDQGQLEGFYILPYGFVFFVFAQSFILARKSAIAYETAERLSKSLSAEVKKQTGKLEKSRDQALRSKIQIERQAEELKVLDRQKTEFFQNISHELRTPLTLILGPLEEARKGRNQELNVSVAEKNSRRLYRLVNQLLDFQKISAGKMSLEVKDLHLNSFLESCSDYFRPACDLRNVSFSLSFDKAAEDISVKAEVDALEKVIFNYLSNALKYSSDSGEIILGLSFEGVNKGMVRVFVKDNGPGISKEDQLKLFTVFQQLDASDSRKFEGSGLGLALVKELTEMMGGNCGVDSLPGQGSTFYLDLNLSETKTDALEEFKVKDWHLEEHSSEVIDLLPDRQNSKAENMILVVDDISAMRGLLRSKLNRNNYDVIEARNGREAFEKALEYKPDLIITDWMMPEMTGPELIRALKARAEIASTPVILLTAKSDEEAKVLGTEMGADVFLGKPFNELELISAVRNLLKLKSSEKEVVSLNRHLTENVLSRYLPGEIIDQILSGRESFEFDTDKTEITLMFTDLSGFTSLSQSLGADRVARVLNQYLNEMIEILSWHGATIDKFMGDGIMAFWGAPGVLEPKIQAKRACEAAKEMHQIIVEMNKEWQSYGVPELKIRIGLHYGEAIVGSFGNAKRSDYTAIGPSVNLASRIESVCKPGDIYLSENLKFYLAEDQIEEAGTFELKGIDSLTKLYRLI